MVMLFSLKVMVAAFLIGFAIGFAIGMIWAWKDAPGSEGDDDDGL